VTLEETIADLVERRNAAPEGKVVQLKPPTTNHRPSRNFLAELADREILKFWEAGNAISVGVGKNRRG
jgi:hypothetical protein